MEEKDKIINISLDEIIPNRFQPRMAFDEKELNQLANSISRYGIIQPIVVRNLGSKYEIIAGERRYKAARLAGLKKVPAIVNDADDDKSAEIALLENLQRKDLSAIEEAKAYKKLLEKGFTQEKLAAKLSISQSSIANKMRLLSLPNAIQEALLYNKISERHARCLLSIEDKNKQVELLHRIIQNKLTVRETEVEVDKLLGRTREVIKPDNKEEILFNEILNNTAPTMSVEPIIDPTPELQLSQPTTNQPISQTTPLSQNVESKITNDNNVVIPSIIEIYDKDTKFDSNVPITSTVEKPISPFQSNEKMKNFINIKNKPNRREPINYHIAELLEAAQPKKQEIVKQEINVVRPDYDEVNTETTNMEHNPELSSYLKLGSEKPVSNPEVVDFNSIEMPKKYDYVDSVNKVKEFARGIKYSTIKENDLGDKYQIIIEINKNTN